MKHYLQKAFSLTEMAAVTAIIGLMVGMVVSMGGNQMGLVQTGNSERNLATVEKALKGYARAFGRLPCPGDITLTDSDANFGSEGATAGTCTGGTPAANFSSGEVVAGAVPVNALGLPKELMEDGFGNRIVYYVDARMTAENAVVTYPVDNTTVGAITINDAAGGARTTQALFALISHGKNAHGAYDDSGTRVNASSTNTDELENCDCTNAAVDGTFNTTLVQRSTFTDPDDSTLSHDDQVRYVTRNLLTPDEELTVTYSSCTDEHWSNVVLLMNFDSNISDASGSSHTVTANGNATVNTTEKKFGAGSLALDGTGDYLSLADHANWTMEGDYTVELWLKTSTSTFNAIGQWQANTNGGAWSLWNNGVYILESSSFSSVKGSTSSTSLSDNAWHHVAIVRSSGTLKLYIDGTEDTSISIASVNDSTMSLLIGQDGSGSYAVNGYIDDVRITKGVARYTSSFTPPTEAFCTSGSSDDSGNNSEPTSSCPVSSPTFQQTFSYTGSDQSFTVPSGIGCILVKAWGAGGAGNRSSHYTEANGAGGGYATGNITTSEGTEYTVVVGGGGSQSISQVSGSYGGGSDVRGANSSIEGAGGGGLSGVFTGTSSMTFNTTGQARAVLIAGGGGGGGLTGYHGGAGGGTTGASGVAAGYGAAGGGTQSAGGNAVTGTDGRNSGSGDNGSALKGGIMGDEGGGGGGGGYYGGGGGRYSGSGGSNTTGGGGGSGYCHPTSVSDCTLTAGSSQTPGNNGDSDYSSGTATGGGANTAGTHGYVVIKW